MLKNSAASFYVKVVWMRCCDTQAFLSPEGVLFSFFRDSFSMLWFYFSEMRGRKVMQMDGMCAAVTAIMELMVHDTYGKTEYFKGCPEGWKNVSFENIRLADGTCVSGVRENGKVQIFKK